MSEKTHSPVGVSLIQIGAENAGQRIDNFLLTQLKGVPKSHIYRILRTGEVRVNGGRIQAGKRLSAGDVVRLPPVRTSAPVETPVGSVSALRRRLESRILMEDSDLLVIDKPGGIAVHGGSGLSLGIIEGLRRIREEARFLELVHRLDRDTSGCLVIAKKRSALRALHEQFRGKEVQKVYTALLEGVWHQASRRVEQALEKNVLQSGERLVKPSEHGKNAVTVFRRLQGYRALTLVEAEPLTGRTHQIRVHAKCLGHPIAGDQRYGSSDRTRELRQMGLRRLFLHAARLTFTHPGTREPLSVEAPLDPELQHFLAHLR